MAYSLTPAHTARPGNILVRVRSWLGNLKLGAQGTATWNNVGTDVRYRTYAQTQDTAYHADDGSSYVDFSWPRVKLDQLSTGDTLMLLAPLEPRAKGAALPRSLTLDLQIVPQVMARTGSSLLFHQNFLWTVPLPDHAAPILIDDYLPPGHRQRFQWAPGADDSTLSRISIFSKYGASSSTSYFSVLKNVARTSQVASMIGTAYSGANRAA